MIGASTPIDVSSLSVDQRIELAQELWEGLHDHVPLVPFTDEQMRELRRRVAALDAGTVPCDPWETVQARLLNRR